MQLLYASNEITIKLLVQLTVTPNHITSIKVNIDFYSNVTIHVLVYNLLFDQFKNQNIVDMRRTSFRSQHLQRRKTQEILILLKS